MHSSTSGRQTLAQGEGPTHNAGTHPALRRIQRSSVGNSALQPGTQLRRRFLAAVGVSARRKVPDRNDQTVRPEGSDETGPGTDRKITSGGQSREGVE